MIVQLHRLIVYSITVFAGAGALLSALTHSTPNIHESNLQQSTGSSSSYLHLYMINSGVKAILPVIDRSLGEMHSTRSALLLYFEDFILSVKRIPISITQY